MRAKLSHCQKEKPKSKELKQMKRVDEDHDMILPLLLTTFPFIPPLHLSLCSSKFKKPPNNKSRLTKTLRPPCIKDEHQESDTQSYIHEHKNLYIYSVCITYISFELELSMKVSSKIWNSWKEMSFFDFICNLYLHS